jgi:GNAT superfamily N-acetyltransferase
MAAWCDGQLVGSATSLVITYTGKPHTWAEVADNGFIRASHEPHGDSLYGIDLCVKPAYRSKGIARALYEARKQLVVQSGLDRFVAGCRIPGYGQHASRMSAERYVRLVADAELNDPVLTFMIRQGLTPLQLLPGYVEDEQSLDYAVLVEWRNPSK